MEEVRIFELKDVGLQQAGKSILWTGGLFFIGLIGSFAYGIFINHEVSSIFFHLRNAFVLFIIIFGVKEFFNRKDKPGYGELVLLKIIDTSLVLEIDKFIVFNGNINELKAIRTLDLSNKKDDLQAQIYIGNQTFNLASSLNYNNKSQFNEFVLICEKKLGMKIKPVPFSIYTHNLQGIKYVEYFNPKNPLV